MDAFQFFLQMCTRRLLNEVRFAEYNFIWERLPKGRGDIRILDVGSGYSIFPALLALNGYLAVASDIDNHSCHIQHTYQYALKAGKMRIAKIDARKIPYPGYFFHVITCISTLEHLEDDGDIEAMKEFIRVGRIGGLIFVTIPYRFERERKGFQRYYDEKIIRERILIPPLELEEAKYYGHSDMPNYLTPLIETSCDTAQICCMSLRLRK